MVIENHAEHTVTIRNLHPKLVDALEFKQWEQAATLASELEHHARALYHIAHRHAETGPEKPALLSSTLGKTEGKTRWGAWMQRLFPTKSLSTLQDPDGIYMWSNSRTYFDWGDRLRVLVSGRIAIRMRTKVQVDLDEVVPEVVVYVQPPRRGNNP